MTGSHPATEISLLLAFQLFGLGSADLIVIIGYFVVILGIGFWAMRRIRTRERLLPGRATIRQGHSNLCIVRTGHIL